MYVDEGKDYHFIRQDQEGTWSQKFGTSSLPSIVTDTSGKPVSKLSAIISHESQLGRQYHLAQYFYVPKGGIDVGYDATFAKHIKAGDMETFCKAANILRDFYRDGKV